MTPDETLTPELSRVQAIAQARTAELPGATLEHPFTADIDVYRVRGKMFMFITRVHDEPIVTVKARPADATVLRAAYPEITPGYHMNKKHWVTLREPTTAPQEGEPHGLSEQLIEDLVTEAYLLIVEGLPKAARPVNPDTFGQASA